MTQYQAGTSIPALSQSTLANISITLPPIIEQGVIVAKVEDLMIICNKLKLAIRESQQTQLLLADAAAEQAIARTTFNPDAYLKQ